MSGGDGEKIKEAIDTNYRKGIVRWGDSRVGEWEERAQTMALKGAAIPFKEHFEKLMVSK